MNLGRKPEIVCIGAQKAGTSWLHVILSSRPDIWVPPFKELHYFDNKFLPDCSRWVPWHIKKGITNARKRHLAQAAEPDQSFLLYLKKLEDASSLNRIWYEYVFSQAKENQKCLDVTPEYSCLPDSGIKYFKRHLPDCRIIYLIRHPFERLKSQLRMNIQRSKSQPKNEAQWDDLLDVPALKSRGDYLNNVPRWDAQFDEEQLLYLPFGLIRKDPHLLLSLVERHCDLPTEKYSKVTRQVHKSAPFEIPEYALDRINGYAAPQVAYIQERFGEQFLADSV